MPDEYLRCPRCAGENFFRSRSRSRREKIVKVLLPVRHYRCHDCGWRGVRSSVESRSKWRRKLLRWVGPAILAAILVSLLAFFVADGMRQVRSAARTQSSKRK